ncbi:hypothetical protein diail_10895 [Diaporthe ilicicola]|nr:hypothetical protein diail_10895 [Diaporthe ilicicola]
MADTGHKHHHQHAGHSRQKSSHRPKKKTQTIEIILNCKRKSKHPECNSVTKQRAKTNHKDGYLLKVKWAPCREAEARQRLEDVPSVTQEETHRQDETLHSKESKDSGPAPPPEPPQGRQEEPGGSGVAQGYGEAGRPVRQQYDQQAEFSGNTQTGPFDPQALDPGVLPGMPPSAGMLFSGGFGGDKDMGSQEMPIAGDFGGDEGSFGALSGDGEPKGQGVPITDDMFYQPSGRVNVVRAPDYMASYSHWSEPAYQKY